jgi:hypothetical protein
MPHRKGRFLATASISTQAQDAAWEKWLELPRRSRFNFWGVPSRAAASATP